VQVVQGDIIGFACLIIAQKWKEMFSDFCMFINHPPVFCHPSSWSCCQEGIEQAD